MILYSQILLKGVIFKLKHHTAYKQVLSIISSVVIMVCLGGLYAWSVFVPLLKTEHGLNTAQTQFIFGVTIAVFTMTMILAGKVLEKRGPRQTAFISALLFIAGYLTASYSGGQFYLLLVGIGILSGAGIGFGYVCALSTPLKWIFRRKGLLTGITVAGFGAGAIFLSQVVESLALSGMPVLTIFRIIGIVYGIVVLLSALALFTPPSITPQKTDVTVNAGMLTKSVRFWAIAGGMFAGTFSGLLIMGNLKPIGLSFGVGEEAATLAIAIMAVGNATGRIAWGYVFDGIGGKRSITLALSFLAVSTLALLLGVRGELIFLLISFAVGLGFGANFVLFAAQVSHVYGVAKLGLVYPLIFLAYGAAGIVGPLVGGWLFDIMLSYNVAIMFSAIISAGGGVTSYILFSCQEKVDAKLATISSVRKVEYDREVANG